MVRTFRDLEANFDVIKEAYEELESFAVRAIEVHKAKFGNESDEDTYSEEAYSAAKEAEMILEKARAGVPERNDT